MDETMEAAQHQVAEKTFAHLMHEDCRLAAVTVVFDGMQMVIVPLRMTMPQAAALMALASATMMEQTPEDKGELH